MAAVAVVTSCGRHVTSLGVGVGLDLLGPDRDRLCRSCWRVVEGWLEPATEGVDGIARFHDLVGRFAEEPAEVVIGIEADRGLFVAALVAAGYQVYAVNPLSTSRYRDRPSVGGAKSDPADAKVLTDMVRTDRLTTG